MRTLNKEGYPINPNSIYIAVQRRNLPHLKDFKIRLGGPNKRLGIPIRHLGTWETLCGRITAITEFSDGVVIHFPQILDESPLKWPKAILWIPNTGTAGILNPQSEEEPTWEELQEYMDEQSHNHTVAASTLIYIIEDLFKDRDCLPYGITKGQVKQMTQFQQIELLEQITRWSFEARQMLGDLSGIMEFLHGVNKNSFRSADDFKRVPEHSKSTKPTYMEELKEMREHDK